MQVDLKTLTTFGQHLRSHLNVPSVDFTDMGIQLHTIKVFAFHEEQVWHVNMTTTVTENNFMYDIDAVHTFVLRTEMIETENGYQDTFNLYEDQEAVVVVDKRLVGEVAVEVAPEIAELKTESQIIMPS
ncbi:hypothetical protein VPHK469_0195 [Vibrio phage K469]